MELNHLPIIDWELSTKLAGNKTEVAEELLHCFVNKIGKDLHDMYRYHQEANYKALLRQVHNLHGALCYCGLPRLKAIVAHLESQLKTNILLNLSSLLHQLETEVSLLYQHYSLDKEQIERFKK